MWTKQIDSDDQPLDTSDLRFNFHKKNFIFITKLKLGSFNCGKHFYSLLKWPSFFMFTLLTSCNREDSGQRADDSLQHDPAPLHRGHLFVWGAEVEGLRHPDEVHHDAAQVSYLSTTLQSIAWSCFLRRKKDCLNIFVHKIFSIIIIII